MNNECLFTDINPRLLAQMYTPNRWPMGQKTMAYYFKQQLNIQKRIPKIVKIDHFGLKQVDID